MLGRWPLWVDILGWTFTTIVLAVVIGAVVLFGSVVYVAFRPAQPQPSYRPAGSSEGLRPVRTFTIPASEVDAALGPPPGLAPQEPGP
jgi:hypothetical protein